MIVRPGEAAAQDGVDHPDELVLRPVVGEEEDGHVRTVIGSSAHRLIGSAVQRAGPLRGRRHRLHEGRAHGP